MKDKYNPSFLLLCVATCFKSEGKNFWEVGNDEIAKYEIVIEIKDSAEKFRIRMAKNKVELIRGVGLSGLTKDHDELEKNKDNLGAVIVNRKQKTSINHSNYEVFWNCIS